MEVESLIKKYLGQGRMMQIATVKGDQPWVCTVYYVQDKDQNLYWLSLPDRRHSQEITQHNKVAIAIAVKAEQPVIGVQAEGIATIVTSPTAIAEIMRRYVEKYNTGQDFYDNAMAGRNHHVLYRFTPERFGLFDELTFNDGVRREWIIP